MVLLQRTQSIMFQNRKGGHTMSTKIYNAYRFNGNLNQLESVKREIKQMYHGYILETLLKLKNEPLNRFFKDDGEGASVVYEWENDRDKSLKDLSYGVLNNVLEYHSERCLVHPLNFSASIVLYIHTNDIYLQFFGLDSCESVQKYIQELRNKGILLDYHYQDQTDKPENVSDIEWQMREEVWNEIFESDSRPFSAGFVNDLASCFFSVCYEFRNLVSDRKGCKND